MGLSEKYRELRSSWWRAGLTTAERKGHGHVVEYIESSKKNWQKEVICDLLACNGGAGYSRFFLTGGPAVVVSLIHAIGSQRFFTGGDFSSPFPACNPFFVPLLTDRLDICKVLLRNMPDEIRQKSSPSIGRTLLTTSDDCPPNAGVYLAPFLQLRWTDVEGLMLARFQEFDTPTGSFPDFIQLSRDKWRGCRPPSIRGEDIQAVFSSVDEKKELLLSLLKGFEGEPNPRQRELFASLCQIATGQENDEEGRLVGKARMWEYAVGANVLPDRRFFKHVHAADLSAEGTVFLLGVIAEHGSSKILGDCPKFFSDAPTSGLAAALLKDPSGTRTLLENAMQVDPGVWELASRTRKGHPAAADALSWMSDGDVSLPDAWSVMPVPVTPVFASPVATVPERAADLPF